MHAFEVGGGVFALEDLALDPFEADLDAVGDAAVDERFDQRFVGVFQAGVFADDGDRHFALGRGDGARDVLPAGEIGRGCAVDAERFEHLLVEAFAVIGEGDVVDRGCVEGLDDGLFAHVAEQRDLLALGFRDLAVGAAHQDVGLDADRAQLFHRVLRGLGLELAGGGDPRHERQVDEDGRAARELVAELADGFEEGQAFDVADRAADFDEHEVDAVVAGEDELLDGVRDVRDHLHRAAQVVAAAFAGEDVLVDAAGGDVVGLLGRDAGEALVVAEVEVRLGAVVGDEDLAVLIGAHRSGIDVEIRVELAETYGIPTRLQKRAECG